MPPATASRLARDIPPLRAPYAPPDEGIAGALLASANRSPEAEARIDARARRLVAAIRARSGGLGGIEDFLHAYSLSTKEGLALMVLAEALLRVPDAATADRLIEDKLKAGDWAHHEARSTSLLVSASAWTLGVTARVIHPGETPEGIVDTLVKRLGLPAVRTATRQAMAAWCTVTSVLGGLLGYSIGALLYDSLGAWLIHLYGYGDKVEAFREAYAQWGAWIILLKGLTPIPYKVVTITSGFAGYNLGLFLLFSIITRGARFFVLAFLLHRYGDRARHIIEKRLGLWVTLGAAVIVAGVVAALYLI